MAFIKSWDHKPSSSPDFTKEELEKIFSFCESDPSLESVRLKVEDSLLVHWEWDRMIEMADLRISAKKFWEYTNSPEIIKARLDQIEKTRSLASRQQVNDGGDASRRKLPFCEG